MFKRRLITVFAAATIVAAASLVSLTATAQAATIGANVAGWGADTDPAQVPAACKAGATRFTNCSMGTVWANVVDVKTKAVLGSTQLLTMFWGELNPKSRRWRFETKVKPLSATGILAVGSSVASTPVCTNGCQVANSSLAAVPLEIGTPLRGAWTITSDADGQTITSSQLLRFTVTNPLAPGPAQVSTQSLGEVRCDSADGFGGKWPGGCVYTANTPTFTLSGSALPPLTAAHGVRSPSPASRPPWRAWRYTLTPSDRQGQAEC